jgi:hypothetical protein
LSIDRTKVAAEARLDGKYLLATSDPDLSAEDVALGYKNLMGAERAFRTMKSTLYLRPVYHRLDDRIRAHVLPPSHPGAAGGRPHRTAAASDSAAPPCDSRPPPACAGSRPGPACHGGSG